MRILNEIDFVSTTLFWGFYNNIEKICEKWFSILQWLLLVGITGLAAKKISFPENIFIYSIYVISQWNLLLYCFKTVILSFQKNPLMNKSMRFWEIMAAFCISAIIGQVAFLIASIN